MSVTYSFIKNSSDGLSVTPDLLFTGSQPYGFITEQNRDSEPLLQYPELTSGFTVPFWYQDTPLTHIIQDEHGCRCDRSDIPLCFQAKVPKQGNYLARITLTNPTDEQASFLLFTGRRRIAAIQTLAAHAQTTLSTQINVTDIIPRGQTERKIDSSINISLIGSNICLTSAVLSFNEVPTLYIAGDSTVTDQTGDYPYRPEQCYSGWGQAFTLYLSPAVSLSNHAHSGLTTESFREEGHHAIVLDAIRPGDYFFMQFAHNDQKLDHLKSEEGYRRNLVRYIEEIRGRGAYPILVTPLGRNTWRGVDGTYNDLLAAYADTCRRLAAEYHVPLIDLHRASTSYLISHGLDDSRRLFFPGDYTHTNDYGAVTMARYVAEFCRELASFEGYAPLAASIIIPPLDFTPPLTVSPAVPPAGFVDDRPKQSGPAFMQTIDRPEEPVTRAEAFSLLSQAIHFFPINVYNDMYEDVIGHEWYAGTVQCAYQNGMISPELVSGRRIEPDRPVTLEEFCSMAVNAYASRKLLPADGNAALPVNDASSWTLPYLRAAHTLGWIDGTIRAKQILTREQARAFAQKVNELAG